MIDGVKIDRDGYVYIMIDYQNLTKTPTFYDVREGLSVLFSTVNVSSLKNGSYYYRSRFELAAKKALGFEFSGLKHYTNYSLFIYASADDPSYFQPRTYVYRIDIATPPMYVNDRIKLMTIIILNLILWW